MKGNPAQDGNQEESGGRQRTFLVTSSGHLNQATPEDAEFFNFISQ